MSWFENNPIGVSLVSVCGVLVLMSAGLGYVWNKPANSGVSNDELAAQFEGEPRQMISELGPISEYREVTERPLFDESRRPVLLVDGEGLDLDEMLDSADAPDVRLTGVIITPDVKLAMLRPSSSNQSVVAHEGEELEGEYYGWSVSDVKPRSVVLASRDGESIQLDLQVNTRRIAEPPKPEPQVANAANKTQSGRGQGAGRGARAQDENGKDGQPLSRAEEIRQRIAERREELRRQAEENSPVRNTSRADRSNSSSPSAYQSAIQNMINRSSRKNEEDDNDKSDGDGSGD